ncbi:proline-rich receptor-like protein kinase PERK8 [Iris pallida]|uniref:Proline-rich receptor-like protein kinase PERK8 n=1 Tax=Iris pallida TaxID=29817 RepID=A0AAX6GMV1_IRIPA|nr:proline-rich receptor-like protein kinase PERK8 [Iris pallida]
MIDLIIVYNLDEDHRCTVDDLKFMLLQEKHTK